MPVDALVATNLTKHFNEGEVRALNKISLRIKTGSITGLVGPDGAGKTTFLRLAAGLLAPSEGKLSVLGLDPFKDHSELLNKVGYMPQRFGLYEDLSIIENLELHATLRSLSPQAKKIKFEQLLHFTGLERFTARLSGRLSGGMKQKLGLACSLLGDPSVLLLDEPGVGVDPISRKELWQMVQNLATEGITILWSTAYLDEAELMERIVLLNEGVIVAEGDFAGLKDTVTDRVYTIRNQALEYRTALQKILTHPMILDGVIHGDGIRVLIHREAKNKVSALIKELKALVGSNFKAVPCPACLEDVFLDLMGGIQIRESPLSSVLKKITYTDEESKKPIISAQKLTKTFGEFTAVDEVSLSIKPGIIYGLLGPNGAGKSTAFKLLCGLLKPDKGKSQIAGLTFKQSGQALRQKIGYMAQKFSLYSTLTVRQNLKFFSGIYGLTGKQQNQAIDQMIAIFHLDAYLDADCAMLPLGFKQRLGAQLFADAPARDSLS